MPKLLTSRPNPARVDPALAAQPRAQLAVVTCMDARIDVLDAFGLQLGDAHVIRNAGGSVTDDVIRSLVVSQRKLGTRNVIVMAHSSCGMLSFTDDEFVAELAEDTGQPPMWRPGAFTDLVAHVRHGMTQLRTNPFLHPETGIYGFIIDVKTGAVDQVDPSA
jgi:carbonic anhydrase